MDDKAAKSLLGESFKRQLKMDGRFSAVTFICSKTDDISISEAQDSLGLDEKMIPSWEEIDRLSARRRVSRNHSKNSTVPRPTTKMRLRILTRRSRSGKPCKPRSLTEMSLIPRRPSLLKSAKLAPRRNPPSRRDGRSSSTMKMMTVLSTIVVRRTNQIRRAKTIPRNLTENRDLKINDLLLRSK